ncbi:hypothetical protein ACI1US_00402 [Leucobacter sp. BZR 635]
MSNSYAIYVPLGGGGPTNLAAGIEAGTWGWRDDLSPKHTEALREIREGDLVVIASGVPNLRVPPGQLTDSTFRVLHALKIIRGFFVSAAPLWPDEVQAGSVIYPHRIGFEVIGSSVNAHASTPRLAEALRLSGNTRGRLVNVLETILPTQTTGVAATGRVAPNFTAGSLDAVTTVTTRKEQTALRKYLFDGVIGARCALCGKELPVGLLRTAHIKPRNECSDTEKRDLDNVMSACTLGCDELFERGYLTVDAGGIVQTAFTGFTDLASSVGSLQSRVCSAFGPESKPYFAWHSTFHAGRTQR